MLPTLLTKGSLIEHNGKTEGLDDIVPLDIIISTITKSIVSNECSDKFIILESKTGSGKSTALMNAIYKEQVKNKLFREVYNVQPRVLSTVSIVNELSENKTWADDLVMSKTLGVVNGNMAINPTQLPSLTYITYGMLLKKFLTDGVSNVLRRLSVLVLDEIHEQAPELLLVLFFLRSFYKSHTELYSMPVVVLMSATLDIDKYVKYVSSKHIFRVSGIQFTKHVLFRAPEVSPIKEIVNTVKDIIHGTLSIDKDVLHTIESMSKDILIFLPTNAEITSVYEMLLKEINNKHCMILPLDRQRIKNNDISYRTAIGVTEQRKVIISTDVAEVGITLQNLGYVIITGWDKTKIYAGYQHNLLTKIPISLASYTQKAGRVGRKNEGVVINIFEKEVLDKLTPARMPILQKTCLSNLLLMTGIDIKQVLGNLKSKEVDDVTFIEPVHRNVYTLAINELISRSMIDENYNYTAVGKIAKHFMIEMYSQLVLDDIWLIAMSSMYGAAAVIDACRIVGICSSLPDMNTLNHTIGDILALYDKAVTNLLSPYMIHLAEGARRKAINATNIQEKLKAHLVEQLVNLPKGLDISVLRNISRTIISLFTIATKVMGINSEDKQVDVLELAKLAYTHLNSRTAMINGMCKVFIPSCCVTNELNINYDKVAMIMRKQHKQAHAATQSQTHTDVPRGRTKTTDTTKRSTNNRSEKNTYEVGGDANANNATANANADHTDTTIVPTDASAVSSTATAMGTDANATLDADTTRKSRTTSKKK